MAQSIKEIIKSRLPFTPNGSGIDDLAASKLRQAGRSDAYTFFEMFASDPEGLLPGQVEEKLLTEGLNEVDHEKAPSWLKQLFEAFVNPFIGVLLIIAAVSFVLDVLMAKYGEEDYKTVITVGIMVMISSLLRFFQEYRSNQAAEKLKSMVLTTATVLRKETGRVEIDIKELVPGDVIILSAGDMIPADCRIIQSKDFPKTE
jgi:Mg2+-importing ATPase